MAAPPFLLPLAGIWHGVNRLQDPHTNAPDESPSEAVVTDILDGKFVRVDYTWACHGAPQSGMLLVGLETQTADLTAAWIDTWHMSEKIMFCQGKNVGNGPINVRGSYAVPPGPDWGWRIVIDADGSDGWRMVMNNIWPDGKEELAVEAKYRR